MNIYQYDKYFVINYTILIAIHSCGRIIHSGLAGRNSPYTNRRVMKIKLIKRNSDSFEIYLFCKHRIKHTDMIRNEF